MDELFKTIPWVALVLTLESNNPTSSLSEDSIDSFDSDKRSCSLSSRKFESSNKRMYYCFLKYIIVLVLLM